MENKEIVDKYLLDNFIAIEEARVKPGFKWSVLADQIIPNLDGEYVRGRFRKIRKKTVVFKSDYPDRERKEYFEESAFPNAKLPIVGEIFKSKNSTSEKPFCYEYKESKKQVDVKSGKAEVTSIVNEEIKTLEDLIRICQIDTTTWNIDKYVQNSWGNPSNQMWQVKAFLSLKQEDQIDHRKNFSEWIEKQNLKKINPAPLNLEKPTKSLDNLLVINCFDAHFGKFAWGKETGEDYDLDIAKERFVSTVKNIALKAYYGYGIKEVILCNGGDYIHFDNQRSETANQTKVESDSRYQKVFNVACDAIVEVLEFLSQTFPSVRFINVNGNHDLTTSYYLGEYINAYFRRDKNITIDNSPKLRKYYQFQEVCFMFTHGDRNTKKLPLVFSREFSNFSQCKFPEIHVGHKHRESKEIFTATEELNGILLRTFNSTSSTDSWHDAELYGNSIKKADGLIYHPKYGKIGEINEVIL